MTGHETRPTQITEDVHEEAVRDRQVPSEILGPGPRSLAGNAPELGRGERHGGPHGVVHLGGDVISHGLYRRQRLLAAIPTIGWLSGVEAAEPTKRASPKLKTPPSSAASQ